MNLLQQIIDGQNSDFFIEMMQAIQDFAKAYSDELLIEIANKFPYLQKPGYIVLTMGLLFSKISEDDLRIELEKRMLNSIQHCS